MHLFPNIFIYISFINTYVDFQISLSYFVIRIFGGTCSSVEKLKGYMVRERLGTSGLND